MKEKLIKLIADYKGVAVEEIASDKTFGDLGLDSLDIAELVMQIEDETGVEIEVSPELNTIDKLAAYISERQ